MKQTEDTQKADNPGPETGRNRRRLARSRDDRYIGGVAAGLAKYFNVDPALVRVAFAVSLVIGGVGVLAYLVLLALVPLEGDPDQPAPPVTGGRRKVAIGGTVVVGVLLLAASASGGSGTSWLFGFGPGVLFGIFLWIVVAAALVWAVRRAGTLQGPGGGASSPSVPAAASAGTPTTRAAATSAPGAAGPPAPAGHDTAASAFAASPTQIDPATAETEVLAEGITAERPAAERPATGAGSRSDAPSTLGRVMTWIAIAIAGLIAMGIIAAISFGVTALFGAIPAAVMVILCGAGVVGLALNNRPQFALWTVAAAFAIAVPMAVVSIASLDIEGDWGEINESPVAAFEIPEDGYKMAGGALKVDLRDFPFRKGETLDLRTNSGFGATSVIVPDDVCVVGDIEGKVGYIDLRGSESEGIEPDRSLPAPAAKVPVLRLDSQFRLGYFGVFDDSGWRGRGGDWPDDLETFDRADAVERATAACLGTTVDGAGGPGTPGGGSGSGGNGSSGQGGDSRPGDGVGGTAGASTLDARADGGPGYG